MQTIEGYVVNSRINTPSNPWLSAPILVASAVAILGAGVSLAAWSHIDTSPRAKFETRAAPVSQATPQAESDLAAFQQAIALSHLAHVEPLKLEAPAIPSPAAAPTREPAPRTSPPTVRKPAPAVAAAVVPPLRPIVVVAPELPPAPAVERPADAGFPIIGGLVRQVGALPTEARGLATGAGDRFFSAVSFVREKAGL